MVSPSSIKGSNGRVLFIANCPGTVKMAFRLYQTLESASSEVLHVHFGSLSLWARVDKTRVQTAIMPGINHRFDCLCQQNFLIAFWRTIGLKLL